MKRIFLTSISCLFLVLTSCKKEDKKTEDVKEETTTPLAKYSINPSSSTVEWTAYKTTAKTPVKGKFLQLSIDNPINSETKQGSLNGLEFGIPISSFFSNNEERDNKIKTVFWSVMKETNIITGNFSEVNGNDSQGTVNLNMTMNTETVQVPMNYKIEGNKIALNGTITNLLDWKMEEAFNSLHKACEVLHTGPDGVSKTWQEVELNAVAVLKEK